MAEPAPRGDEAEGRAEAGDLVDLAADVDRMEELFAGWDEAPRQAALAYKAAVEALHGEALRRLIAAVKGEPAALAALRRAVADDLVYAVLRRLGILRPSVAERVEAALAGVRPMLAEHGGGVELVAAAPPVVEVRFTGACDGCAASTLAFQELVTRAVQSALPEITSVRPVRTPAPQLIAVSSLARGGWRLACHLDDVPEPGARAFTVAGERILVARASGAVACFVDACAHLGLALDGARVSEAGVLTCPHHGFQYELATGECLSAPGVRLQSHAVRVAGDRVEVRLAR
jgi:nitrite reductase/ring-hydroxylating ferredoxin subunit/Fe-S cluster biogenesis protein NfuA